jgi:2-dehydropantoate 2-reductase
MLQDILNGHKTEIDFLNGAVTAVGYKHRIRTPYNDCIANLIRFKETIAGIR